MTKIAARILQHLENKKKRLVSSHALVLLKFDPILSAIKNIPHTAA